MLVAPGAIEYQALILTVLVHTQDLQQVSLQQLGQQLHCLWTIQL